jgi:ubiquinone/menaquinone biosynthesis C-methylase UbiE
MKKIEAQLLRKEWRNFKSYFRLKNIFIQYILESKKHLDFGCGFGCLPYLLAQELSKTKVVGIDVNKDKISVGTKRYKAKNLKLLVSGHITGKFDSISCFHVLHHLNNVKKYLNGFYSHLNPGGIIIIYDHRKVTRKRFRKFYYEPRLKELQHTKIKLFPLKGFEEEYKIHSKWNIKEFISMIEKVGFKTMKMKREKLNLLYIGKKKNF